MVQAGVALLMQQGFNFLLREVGRNLDGKGQNQAWVIVVLCQLANLLGDAVGIVAAHRLGALAAIQLAQTGVQQLDVIVQLRHGAHGTARVAHRVHLVNGNGGQDAFNAVDLGLVHAVQELARIGRKGFHIAPLPLCIQGIKGQRAFA